MENQVQLFEHAKFGKVRVVIINGEIHFVAADVCRALEIKNSRDAMTRLEGDEKMTVDLTGNHSGKRGGAQFMTVVNEPGLYRLVFSSRKKEARQFQHWIYHEVLPAIRATGLYLIEKILMEFLESAATASSVQMCVYVLEMNNATIKIGITSNFEKRKRNIETGSGLTVVRDFHTHYFDEKNARLIELFCKENFSSRRVQGEFFSVTFEEACAEIDSFTKTLIESLLFKSECGGKIFKVAKRNIVESAKLIVDKQR